MSDLSPRFRPVLDTVPAYKPGKAPVAATGEAHKLSSNESPYGPLPSVVEVIAEAGSSVNRYPDNGAEALIGAIAERFAVPAEHVAVGCGSVGVLKQLMEAVSDPGSEVLYAWRSFEAYPPLADLAGATSVRVPLRQETHDLAAMAEAITPRTRLILVCNPNNPTGTVVREQELTDFLDQVPADCLVVLDEAYREYIRDPGVPDGIELYRDRPNVAVLRTFSKAYGLAGLRVGFLIGHEAVAECRSQDDAPLHGQLGGPGRRGSLAERRERALGARGDRRQGTRPGKRGAAGRRLDGPGHRSELRLAPPRRAHDAVCSGVRSGGNRGPALRGRRRARLDRHKRRERRFPRDGERLPAQAVIPGRAAGGR